VRLEKLLLLYSKDVMCCVCLEHLVLQYIRNVMCCVC